MLAEPIETTTSDAFAERMLGVYNHAALALMTSVGHRTGLFDTLASISPATSGELADAAGLSERYVREWLAAMVTGRVVEYDPRTRYYRLPAEHAALLTRSASPDNLAVTAQWFSVLGSVEDHIVDAFRHGRGVPYDAYHGFHRVMAEESDQTTIGGLFTHILPLVPGLTDRLAAGIDVLDVGCGSGRALIRMASAFPASRFTGYDLTPEGVSRARAGAEAAGCTNVRFEVSDAAAMPDTAAFDLITAFDAIHDQAYPARVLANIRRALRDGGVFLMQDIAADTHLEGNVGHPMGPFLYTISCMHCMSVSLGNGGVGLGAAWGTQQALRMLGEAGFHDVEVERLPHDILNCYYVAHV